LLATLIGSVPVSWLSCLLSFIWWISTSQEHSRIVNCDTISRAHIHNDALLLIFLERDLATLLLGLQDQTWNIDVQLLLIQVTCDFDLDFLSLQIVLIIVASDMAPIALVSGINGILNRNEYSFDCIVGYVSINDESLLV